jgi:hypothetical protein
MARTRQGLGASLPVFRGKRRRSFPGALETTARRFPAHWKRRAGALEATGVTSCRSLAATDVASWLARSDGASLPGVPRSDVCEGLVTIRGSQVSRRFTPYRHPLLTLVGAHHDDTHMCSACTQTYARAHTQTRSHANACTQTLVAGDALGWQRDGHGGVAHFPRPPCFSFHGHSHLGPCKHSTKSLTGE